MTTNQSNTSSFFVKWLEKSYTLNNTLPYKILISIGMGFISFCYLTFFQPSTTLKNTNNLFLHAKIIGIIVSMVLLIYYFVVRPLFPSYFNIETWNIGNHLFVVFWLMIFGCFIFWVYQKYSSYGDFTGEITLLNIIDYIFSVGFVPLIIYLFIDERYSTYQQKKQHESNNDELIIEDISSKEMITVLSYNEKDSVSFTLDSLVYITSEGNNTIFFILENNQVQKHSFRQTLSKVQKDLEEFTSIVRCHKSYFINSKFIINYNGNSRGGLLKIAHIDNEIPVSRNVNIEELTTII